MIREDEVAELAREFDKIKPGWERLVPLEPGKVIMRQSRLRHGVGCVCCHVFTQEAGREGFVYFIDNYPELTQISGAVSDEQENWPIWRDEIVSRLAKWEPSADVRAAAKVTS